MIVIQHILTFYAVGAFLMGGVVASMDSVNFHVRGRPMPCPRLWAGVVSAIFWPLVLFKIVTGK